MPLALLTIAYASLENPAGIDGGADILTLTKEKGFSVERYTQSQFDAMRKRFNDEISAAKFLPRWKTSQ